MNDISDELKYNIISYIEPHTNYSNIFSSVTFMSMENKRFRHYNAKMIETKLKNIFGRTFFFDLLSENYKNIDRKTLTHIINNIFNAVYPFHFETNNFMNIHTLFNELKKFDNNNIIDDFYFEERLPIYDPNSRIIMVGNSYTV